MENAHSVARNMFASVWDALEDTPAIAENLRLRSRLMREIGAAVSGWQQTQALSAQRLQITQPRLNDLLRGRIENFSLDALIVLAGRAGLCVKMHVENAA